MFVGGTFHVFLAFLTVKPPGGASWRERRLVTTAPYENVPYAARDSLGETNWRAEGMRGKVGWK